MTQTKNPVDEETHLQQKTLGISGPNLDAIRQGRGDRRFWLSPAWQHAGTEYRNLINPLFDQGHSSAYFTLRGRLGPYNVVVTVTDYKSGGQESNGDAQVELASVVDARPARHTLAPQLVIKQPLPSFESAPTQGQTPQ